MVLEKTLEGPLDCKEIQPVHPKGDQSWVFFWKDWCWSQNSNTLATLCKQLTLWKTPWCWEGVRAGGKGDKRMRWLDVIIDTMDMGLGELRELVMTGRPGVLRLMGLQGQTWVSDWTYCLLYSLKILKWLYIDKFKYSLFQE